MSTASVQKAINHPFDPIALETKWKELGEISWGHWSYLNLVYCCQSQVLKSHAAHMKAALIHSIEKLGSEQSEESKILKEKINVLTQNAKCWFHEAAATPPEHRNWTPIVNTTRELLQPVVRLGRFYNGEEKHEDLVKQSIRLLFPGAMAKPTEINLSTLSESEPPQARSQEFQLQWIGHSTMLVQVLGHNFLFDPFFEMSARGKSPFIYGILPQASLFKIFP